MLLTWFSNVLNCHSLIFSHKAQHREDEKSTVETCSTVTEGKYDGISTLRKNKKRILSPIIVENSFSFIFSYESYVTYDCGV